MLSATLQKERIYLSQQVTKRSDTSHHQLAAQMQKTTTWTLNLTRLRPQLQQAARSRGRHLLLATCGTAGRCV